SRPARASKPRLRPPRRLVASDFETTRTRGSFRKPSALVVAEPRALSQCESRVQQSSKTPTPAAVRGADQRVTSREAALRQALANPPTTSVPLIAAGCPGKPAQRRVFPRLAYHLWIACPYS